MTKQVFIRFLVGAALLVLLITGFNCVRGMSDWDFGSVDSSNWIAALQETPSGHQVVVILPNGEVRGVPDHKPGERDSRPTWRPDGNRIFFSANRGEEAFNIYRWNLSNNRVERRSTGSRAKGVPSFGFPTSPNANDVALITTGGFVMEFEPSTGSIRQILPPVPRSPTATVTNNEDGGGAVGQFDQLYNQFGNTFKEARWNHDKTFIYALMARDNEEVLIVQNVADPNSPPMPIAAGDRINFDVSPIDGSLVFAVRNFRFPLLELVPEQFIVNNRVVVPFRNALAMLNPEQSEPFKLVAASDTDEVAFASPAISPDGKSIVVVVGEAGDDFAFTPLTLVLLPAAELSAPQAQPLLEGSVYEPAWSPDGTRIVFALTEGTNRNIYTISSSGTNRRKVSPDGVFSHPSFSPQR